MIGESKDLVSLRKVTEDARGPSRNQRMETLVSTKQ